MWGVRKACADVFMPVSCVCSPSVRKSELSPLFVQLLRDQSRWVRMAAFQALGPFISTFADPGITALLHNDNGEIVVTEPDTLAKRLDQLEEQREEERLRTKSEEGDGAGKQQQPDQETFSSVICPKTTTETNASSPAEKGGSGDEEDAMELVAPDEEPASATEGEDKEVSVEERRAMTYAEKKGKKSSSSSSEAEELFNSFHFWREPVLPLESGGSGEKPKSGSEEDAEEAVDKLVSDLEKVAISDPSPAKEEEGAKTEEGMCETALSFSCQWSYFLPCLQTATATTQRRTFFFYSVHVCATTHTHGSHISFS